MASYNDPVWSGAFAPGSQDPLISGDGSDDWFYDLLNNSVEIVINPDEDALSSPAQFSAQSPTFPAPWNLGFPPSPQFTFQADTNQFNDCPPLMQTPRLTPVLSESPAADVCPMIEDPDSSSSGEAEVRTTRREKKCENGFPCRHLGCNKVFHRAGDARKHARRTHTPNAQRRHTCPHCPKRFNWPKDVKRHFDNVHAGESHALVRRDPKIRLDPRFGGNMAPPANPTGCLMGLFLMAIRTRKLVIRMRARRQSQSSANRRFVMVTRDGTNFRAIEVTAAESSSMLVDIIAQAHKLPGMSQVQLSTYSLGSGVTQRRPSLDKLFTMISQASMGNAPMQLLLEPVIKEEMTDDWA